METFSYKALTFGRGAFTAHGVGRRRLLEGGGWMCTTVRADGLPDPDAPGADWGLYEGAWTIDMRQAAGTDAGVSQVISGPLLDPALGAHEFRRVLADNQRPEVWQGEHLGGFDSVGAAVYAGLWRKVGAKVGRVTGGRIVWEGRT